MDFPKQPMSSHAYDLVAPAVDRHPWRTGLLRLLPWLGLGALAGSIAAVGAAVAILIV